MFSLLIYLQICSKTLTWLTRSWLSSLEQKTDIIPWPVRALQSPNAMWLPISLNENKPLWPKCRNQLQNTQISPNIDIWTSKLVTSESGNVSHSVSIHHWYFEIWCQQQVLPNTNTRVTVGLSEFVNIEEDSNRI